MKKLFYLFITILSAVNIKAQNIGIGTASPSVSAKLDVTSNSQGFLPPRLTFAQRGSIISPVAGLEIWNIDCKELEVYNGTAWTNMIGGPACVGYIYDTASVTICNQVWRIYNLSVSTYRNGDSIPQVTDGAQWSALTTGAWCWYNNDSATYASTYGKLYNWYAVNDARGLAPLGWHVPSQAEWSTLSTCLGGDAVAGGKMKEEGLVHWFSPNNGADNSSGFTGLPGGARSFNGSFSFLGNYGYFWTSTQFSAGNAWNRYLLYSGSNLNTDIVNEPAGFSVRCLKD